MKYGKRYILKKLIDAEPRPLDVPEFGIPEEEQKNFYNLIVKMEISGLIKADIQTSKGRDTNGEPLGITDIYITGYGKTFYNNN